MSWSKLKQMAAPVLHRVSAFMAVGRRRARPADWGNLRTLEPVSRKFGMERGQAICRYYIEKFLARHAADIQGRVLEFGDAHYTREFGANRVVQSDVLHIQEGNPAATLVADLTRADHLPDAIFDCIICTQVLLCIFDVRAAAKTLHRLLRPGGVLLATVPGISPISRYDMDRWGDQWRFTTASFSRMLGEHRPKEHFEVETHGNVLVAASYLFGLASEELAAAELDFCDPDYQVLIAARAVKP